MKDSAKDPLDHLRTDLNELHSVAGDDFESCMDRHTEISELEKQIGTLETWFSSDAKQVQFDFDTRIAHVAERTRNLQKKIKGG